MVNAPTVRLMATGSRVNCRGATGKKTKTRTRTRTKTVNAPVVRLIATESLVNVAEPRLKVKG